MSIKIHNLSTCVSDVETQHMIDALNVLLPKFCEAWGLGVVVAEKPSGKSNSDYNFHIVDSPESKMDDADGYVLAKTILDCGGVVLWKDDETVTVASNLAHEIMETLLDQFCNLWVQSKSGTMISFEICDPVQECIVKVTTPSGQDVGMANFLLPTWMNPHALDSEKFDHLGVLNTPFSMSPGGYIIVMGMDGTQSQMSGRKTNLLLLHHKMRSSKSRVHRRANRLHIKDQKKPRFRAL